MKDVNCHPARSEWLLSPRLAIILAVGWRGPVVQAAVRDWRHGTISERSGTVDEANRRWPTPVTVSVIVTAGLVLASVVFALRPQYYTVAYGVHDSVTIESLVRVNSFGRATEVFNSSTSLQTFTKNRADQPVGAPNVSTPPSKPNLSIEEILVGGVILSAFLFMMTWVIWSLARDLVRGQISDGRQRVIIIGEIVVAAGAGLLAVLWAVFGLWP